jgi:hypothetical protein
MAGHEGPAGSAAGSGVLKIVSERKLLELSYKKKDKQK